MTSWSGPRKHTKRNAGRPGPICISTIGASVAICNAASSAHAGVEISHQQRGAPHPEGVGGASGHAARARHAESDEDEPHLASAGRGEHDLVHSHRPGKVQVRRVRGVGRETRSFLETERTVERKRVLEIRAAHRDERHPRGRTLDAFDRGPVGIVGHDEAHVTSVRQCVRGRLTPDPSAESTDAVHGRIEIGHADTDALEPALEERRRRCTDRARLAPLEQVDRAAFERVRTDEDPRVPPRAVEPERRTGLSGGWGSTHCRVEPERLRVEQA